MKLPRFDLFWLALVVGIGAAGGATSLSILARRVEWLYGGLPAHPTSAGYTIIAVYGAFWGALTGWGIWLIFNSSRVRAYSAKTRSPLMPWVVLVLALVAGAVGPLVMLPFHAPIPMELDP